MGSIQSPKLPSDRSFGLLFTTVFVGVGVYGWARSWDPLAVIAWLAVGAVVALVSWRAPRLLGPFNQAWFLLGQLLGKIVSPLVFAVIFFGLLTPIAFLMRLRGRDELRLKRRPAVTFWIDRTPPGPDADSFKNQF